MEVQKKIPGSYTGTNICFTCQNACGRCSWSAINPATNKPRFEPVPGWTAQKVLLSLGAARGKKYVTETYHITACPEYVPDDVRKMDTRKLSDEAYAALMEKWRIWGWI